VSACGSNPDGGSSDPDGAKVKQSRAALTANVNPEAIQIDGPASGSPGADLFPNVGTPLNAGATADWVADSAANTGTGCLRPDGIATCVQPGVTGATGGTGHWNGLRIVDGFAGGDQDIFLTGGKENEFQTWDIGPGSVGSSKYDIVQAYLANNQSTLFFGMERRGNNGTTAFDFEFNQLAPGALPSCPANPLIPCRSANDILFVFLMQGSGSSGSATPFIFTWNGSAYTPISASGVIASINNSTTTVGGPWGHVDSHGDWVLGNLDRFTFAEAAAPISLLPGVNACGGKAFVQVRTRSSSTDTSDLKDTTRVFEFQFLNLGASATLTPSCEQGFGYSADATDANGDPLTGATCHWTFSNGATSDTCSGAIAAAPGTYTGTVQISHPNLPGCTATATSAPVNVHPPLGVVASLGATCQNAVTYGASASGGSNPSAVGYAWTFSGGGTTTPSSSTSQNGVVTVGTPGVAYTGTVVVTDPRTDIVCTASAQASATPFAPLIVNLVASGTGAMCPGITEDSVTYTAVGSGGDGAYSFTWNGAECSGTACTIDPADATFCHDQSVSVTLSDGSGLCAATTSETETYKKVTVVTASDNP
jgi:hypothetical protein